MPSRQPVVLISDALSPATVAALGLSASVDVEVAQISFAVGEGIPARRTVSLS